MCRIIDRGNSMKRRSNISDILAAAAICAVAGFAKLLA